MSVKFTRYERMHNGWLNSSDTHTWGKFQYKSTAASKVKNLKHQPWWQWNLSNGESSLKSIFKMIQVLKLKPCLGPELNIFNIKSETFPSVQTLIGFVKSNQVKPNRDLDFLFKDMYVKSIKKISPVSLQFMDFSTLSILHRHSTWFVCSH